MKQLTIRGFDEDLDRAIRQLARRDGISLNRAALKLLRRGAGLPDGQGDGETSATHSTTCSARGPSRRRTRTAHWSTSSRSMSRTGNEGHARLGRLLGVHAGQPAASRRSPRRRGGMSAVVVGELMYGFAGTADSNRTSTSCGPSSTGPTCRSCRSGPVTADRYSRIMDVAEGEGTTNPNKRGSGSPHTRWRPALDLVSADSHFGHIEQVVWVSVTSD